MPFEYNINFNPSEKYKEDWSKVPQNLNISFDVFKTKSFFGAFSSRIPIYYSFSALAILADAFIGFKFLTKSGVSSTIVFGLVLADIILAVLPYLFNLNKNKNELFVRELELITREKNESDENFSVRRTNKIQPNISDLKKSNINKHVIIGVIYFFILCIAGWKIFSYIKVLPPEYSIFATLAGKFVIVGAILVAILHIIASEKTFSHIKFLFSSKSEVKNHKKSQSNLNPVVEKIPVNYEGEYLECNSFNTSLVIENNHPYIKYSNIIRDEEIVNIVNQQKDNNAKKAIFIVCKKNQLKIN